METGKEEVIKKAYARYWNNLSENAKGHILDCEGAVSIYRLGGPDRDVMFEDVDIRDEGESRFECIGTDEGTRYLFRPRALRGIENNNGWTPLENIETIPKEGILGIIVRDSSGNSQFTNYKHLVNRIREGHPFTHYQLIRTPIKEPIY